MIIPIKSLSSHEVTTEVDRVDYLIEQSVIELEGLEKLSSALNSNELPAKEGAVMDEIVQYANYKKALLERMRELVEESEGSAQGISPTGNQENAMVYLECETAKDIETEMGRMEYLVKRGTNRLSDLAEEWEEACEGTFTMEKAAEALLREEAEKFLRGEVADCLENLERLLEQLEDIELKERA